MSTAPVRVYCVPPSAPWLGRIPARWPVLALKHIEGNSGALVQTGPFGAQLHADDYVADGVPLILIGHVQNGRIRPTPDMPRVASTRASELALYRVRTGDLVFSRVGSVGRVALVQPNQEGWLISGQTLRLRFSSGRVHPAYMLYALGSAAVSRYFEHRVVGTTRDSINTEILRSAVVPLPPVDDQRAIANFLDRKTSAIDAVIAKKQRLLDNLAEMLQATVESAILRGVRQAPRFRASGVAWLGSIPDGWGVSKVKHVMSHIVDCPHSTPEYTPEGAYPAIRTADVDRGRLNLKNALRVSYIEYRSRVARLEPTSGDILYSREGERFGMAALVPFGVKLCMAQRMMLFRARREMSARYLMWALNSQAIFQQVKQDTVGATSPRINIPTITNAWVPVPPLEEQVLIAGHIESASQELDRRCSTIQRQLEYLLEYRQAVISGAVTGELDIAAQSQEAA